MIIYDIESYPNFFCLCAKHRQTGVYYYFEISTRRNDTGLLIEFIHILKNQSIFMVGFNNLGYDYPVVHTVVNGGNHYAKTVELINSGDDFGKRVKDPLVQQIDLYLINHFNNKAKATNLKQLEFVRRSLNLQDLPFEAGQWLSEYAMGEVARYCFKDCEETAGFLEDCSEAVDFRIRLNNPHLLNADDTKLGEYTLIEKLGRDKFFDMYGNMRQTPRHSISLNDCISPKIKLENIELRKVEAFLRLQTIKETKGVFTDLSADLKGFKLDFGAGGLHGCVPPQVIRSDKKFQIIDFDVVSYYPSLAISNGFYPEHIGPEFIREYSNLKSERKRHAKGTPENALYKLALNGAYGKSNSQYSPLYDPKFTMQITINGQLFLCMLLEKLLSINLVSAIQANTDGVTMLVRTTKIEEVLAICKEWENYTGLELERNDYSAMFVRDVNNYIAVKPDGSKLKGCYEYKREFHQNHSALVVPKVAELHMVHGFGIEDTVRNWSDPFDFMLFAKSSGSLTINGQQIQRRSRYYVSTGGGTLVKTLRNGHQSRIEAEWLVRECNDMRGINRLPDINYDYYIQEVRKIIVG